MPAIPTIKPFVFSDAVRAFWDTRLAQQEEQRLRGMTDQGTRGSVTGGRQMNGFARVITELLIQAGVNQHSMYITSGTELPGYFRPTKKWDIVIAEDETLIAAIELKSMVGSFGNNLNNRAEEGLGNAVDIWTAYREGAFRTSPQPWLGYLFVLQDTADSTRPVSVKSPRFPAFPEFQNASYTKRCELLCRRLEHFS
jgi:hypothetical protein